MTGNSRSKRFAFGLIIAFLLSVFFFGGLKVVDMVIMARTPPQAVAVVDHDATRLSMNTLDVYPYDGAHTQADFIIPEAGGGLWSGDHGFFVDIDLDNPPQKQQDEVRLILIGGSGAAGWGAQNNYNMVYHRLEKLFNETEPCGPGTWLRVLNLAMGGTHSYQNYIALNRWAHPLEPDLIVSYSGNNDLYVSLLAGVDVYYGFSTLGGLIQISRTASSPRWLRGVARIYPGLVRKSGLGTAFRALSLDRYSGQANAKFNARFPPASSRPVSLTDEAYLAEAVENVTIPQYIHAFQSMRRDFPGVPIMIANQPYMFSMDQAVDPSMDVVMPVPLYNKMYERMRRRAEGELRGYGQGEWVFFDLHEYYQKNLAHKFKSPGDGVHLTDDKTDSIARVIGERAFPVLCKQRKAKRATKPATRFYSKVKPPPWPESVLRASASKAELTIDGKTYRITPEKIAGAAEWPHREPGGTYFSGWAIDAPATREAAEVVLLANGRLIGRVKPNLPRPDIAAMNKGFQNSGWAITVPPDGRLHGRIGVFALMHDGRAHELAYSDPFPFPRGLLAKTK